jgi:hypothetical protein
LWDIARFVLALVLVCLTSASVRAQDAQDTAMARGLFEEGVGLADAGDWAGAEDRFARAHALRPSSGIAFNWASALLELGRVVEASEQLRNVLRDPEAPEDMRSEAQAKLDQASARTAYLTVRVEGDPRGVNALVDDKPLQEAAWGAPAPIDPGEHVVRLLRGERELVSELAMLGDGERRELTLVAPELVLEPTPEPEPVALPPPPVEDRESRPVYKSWVLWTAVGAVVVAGAVTSVLLLGGKDKAPEEPVLGNTEPGVIRWR